MRVERATVSTAGDRYRVVVDGRVSGELPRLALLKDAYQGYLREIRVGDTVAVLFVGSNLADGCVLGVIE